MVYNRKLIFPGIFRQLFRIIANGIFKGFPRRRREREKESKVERVRACCTAGLSISEPCYLPLDVHSSEGHVHTRTHVSISLYSRLFRKLQFSCNGGGKKRKKKRYASVTRNRRWFFISRPRINSPDESGSLGKSALSLSLSISMAVQYLNTTGRRSIAFPLGMKCRQPTFIFGPGRLVQKLASR